MYLSCYTQTYIYPNTQKVSMCFNLVWPKNDNFQQFFVNQLFITDPKCTDTSHSAYVATSTEFHGVKINGFLYPNYM